MPAKRPPPAAPKLGDRCFCQKKGKLWWGHHELASDCFEVCDWDCRAPKLPITTDDLKRALVHHRDHVYHE